MDCIFCSIAAGKIPCRRIIETPRTLSFLDAFPLAAGHTLVIPKTHYERVQEIPPADAADLFETVRQATARVDRITGSTLLAVHNGRESGQEIPHVHVHIVPRKVGDGGGAIHSMFGGAERFTGEQLDAMQRSLTG
jgi:histidine triad (HIT) family protein